jgi:hypothetical protein
MLNEIEYRHDLVYYLKEHNLCLLIRDEYVVDVVKATHKKTILAVNVYYELHKKKQGNSQYGWQKKKTGC